eukprot:2601611-Pyramimonas_sp.AAC.1
MAPGPRSTAVSSAAQPSSWGGGLYVDFLAMTIGARSTRQWSWPGRPCRALEQTCPCMLPSTAW